MTEKETNLKRNLKWWKGVIIAIFLFISILIWAWLTKMGYIPNFLDLEILCTTNNDRPFHIERATSWSNNSEDNDSVVNYLYF